MCVIGSMLRHRMGDGGSINRLTSVVHGDNASIQYFIWQLGYGMFPWVALLPLALMLWFGADSRGQAKQRDALHMLGLWFAVSFTLFSAMTTKFHHYILPAVPPLAAMVGLVLARLLPPGMFQDRRRALHTIAALLAPLCWVLGLAGLHGDVRGIVPADVSGTQISSWVVAHPWPLWACALWLGAGTLLALFASLAASAPTMTNVGPMLLAGAIICAFAGRDLAWNVMGQPPGSERLIHLFVYNYGRPWPVEHDYRAILFGLAVTAVVLSAACAVRRLRAVTAPGLLSLALGFCVFCLDVYMVDLTPHWTQQGLIDRYYAERGSAEEPLLAWQMNWKGENFYTGNRVHAFESLDNDALNAWIKDNKGRRVYFILEHTRLTRLKELLAARDLEVLTHERDCNKFLLARTTL